MTTVWTTPHRAAPVDAVVSLPGSKSITARALILAALADGPSRLVRPLRARDTDLMAAGLRALGVGIEDDGADQLVTPAPLAGPAEVDAGLAGTVLRFLPPVAALADGPVTVDGDARLRDRPNAGLIAGLREAGVRVDDSRPGLWQVAPGPIAGRDVRVEPDLSNAGAFLAAALVAGGTVRVPGWPARTTQPGALLPGILERMGARTRLDGDVLEVTGDGVVHGLDLDLHEAGELAPTIAALAALADSPSRLRGIAHLRGHETDRLTALATEITRLGGQAEQTSDGLVITPRPMHGGVVRTYHDHRMATAGALLGLRVPGVEVEDVATTSKTLPDFVGMWQRMLGPAEGMAAGPAAGPAAG